MWVAPPMLLVDLTPLSAQESGAAVMGGKEGSMGAVGGEVGVRE